VQADIGHRPIRQGASSFGRKPPTPEAWSDPVGDLPVPELQIDVAQGRVAEGVARATGGESPNWRPTREPIAPARHRSSAAPPPHRDGESAIAGCLDRENASTTASTSVSVHGRSEIPRSPVRIGGGDSFGSGGTRQALHSTIVFTRSTDGGLTWSPLSRIDRSPDDVQAFTPAVHAASDGTVGVTYHDFRSNTPDPGLPTDQWFIHCHSSDDCTDPAAWEESHVEGPFDIERAPIARGFFLGDYEGLDSIGTTFHVVLHRDDSDGQGQHLPGDHLPSRHASDRIGPSGSRLSDEVACPIKPNLASSAVIARLASAIRRDASGTRTARPARDGRLRPARR
jgi:hypothetical protein